MGRAVRQKPLKLAEKLTEIRRKLSLSQNELIGRMGLTGEITREEISAFERGIRVPPLPVLLHYARAAGGGFHLEALIDDAMDLPEKLPSVLPQTDQATRKLSPRKRS